MTTSQWGSLGEQSSDLRVTREQDARSVAKAYPNVKITRRDDSERQGRAGLLDPACSIRYARPVWRGQVPSQCVRAVRPNSALIAG